MGNTLGILDRSGRFLVDVLARGRGGSANIPTYVVGFSNWKQYLRSYFPDRELNFLPKEIDQVTFSVEWERKVLARKDSEFFVWGYKAPQYILDFAQRNNKKISYVEDGFVRSVLLGASLSPAMSLTLDTKTPYFNAREPSELEDLLATYDFASNPELIERAKLAIEEMIARGVSKYNKSATVNIENLYGAKDKRRVLVVGQVEDDASIMLGCEKKFTNNDLVRLAVEENPRAQVIYKPHPDVLSGKRPLQSNPDDVKGICQVVRKDIPLPQSFHKVDHVYTITSLSGFEALLRGIKVTTVGCPFYACWGVTDDRQRNERRQRKLTIPEIFAGAYLLYAKYYDVVTGEAITHEDVVREISIGMENLRVTTAEKAKKKLAANALLAKVPANPAATKVTPAKSVPAKPAPAKSAASKPASAKPVAAKAQVKKVPATKSALANTVAPIAISVAPKPPVKPVVKAVVTPAVQPAADEVPFWFNARPGSDLKQALESDLPVYLYIPWIAGHGDALIEKLKDEESYALAPLDIVSGLNLPGVRLQVHGFATTNPGLYRKMLINRLVPLRNKIKGIVFTFDWSPVMRVVASVCAELQIPRILVPHESVFVDRNKYYWDIGSKASVPAADVILGWGGLQKEIFIQRGFPEDRFLAMGAPKFDVHVNYTAQLSRPQFARLFGLDPGKKIILFASQPLDSQLDKKAAQTSQRLAISDLVDVAREMDAQLLIRLPPNKAALLDAQLKRKIANGSGVAVDDGSCYLVSPEEALFHSDVTTSINSTMLFEAVLMGRGALSLKYVEFDQIWAKAGIPAVHNLTELKAALPGLLEGAWKPSAECMEWAAGMFGIGEFDGRAGSRIKSELKKIASAPEALSMRNEALDKLFAGEALDVVAIPSQLTTLSTSQLYLKSMMGARTLISSMHEDCKIKELVGVELFIQWGITDSARKKRQREFAAELGRPVVIVEDGFIRSLDIGLSKEPGMSIILDDKTSYYDATKASRLETLLEHGPALSEAQCGRANKAIEKIVGSRVSKYNHAPDLPLTIGKAYRKKVLLVDQRYGDQSVASGLGSEVAFEKMLHDVIRTRSDCDILIKQHPDAIKGGKSSYFNNERLVFTEFMDNVHLIRFDINPFALFDLVDEVYVVTSGMGFEALMAGKKVYCYGMPFYAGWGQTIDQLTVMRRTRSRSVEELFYFAYIESSRYYHPEKKEVVQVEDLVDYIAANRK